MKTNVLAVLATRLADVGTYVAVGVTILMGASVAVNDIRANSLINVAFAVNTEPASVLGDRPNIVKLENVMVRLKLAPITSIEDPLGGEI